MTHFFEKRDPWGNRLSLWVIVMMAFAGPLCWWSLQQTRFENQFQEWLPDSDPERQAFRWAREHFPVEEQIVVTWDGSSINDPRVANLVDQLVGKADADGIKRGGLPYVQSVVEPRQALEMMQRNGIEPREAVRRSEGTIVGAGPLRVRLTEIGRSAMRKTKRELATAIRGKFGFDVELLDASPDLTALVSIPASLEDGQVSGEPSKPAVLSANGTLLENFSLEHDLQVTWKGMHVGSQSTIEIVNWMTEYSPASGEGTPLVESAFFSLGSPVAVSIGVSEAGLADPQETVSAIRLACKASGIPMETVHLAGNLVSSIPRHAEVTNAAWDESYPLTQFHRRSVMLTSVFACVVLTFAFVRGIRLAAMVLFAAFFATAGSMAIIPLTGGSINTFLTVLPPLFVVLTLSGGILMTRYWRHSASNEESLTIAQTVRIASMPCFLASSTAAIGFLSLCSTHLMPIREFGIYAAIGAMFSLLVLVYGLPSLMQQWGGQPPKVQELDHAGWRICGRSITTHSGWISLAVLAICVGCSVGLMQVPAESTSILRLREDGKIAQDNWYIETYLAGVMPVENVIRFDQQSQKDSTFLDRMEVVRHIEERMRMHPEISGTESLADSQPVTEQLTEDSSFVQKSKYSKRSSAVQQRILNGEVPRAKSFYTVAEKASNTANSDDARLNQSGDELWRITAHVNVMVANDLGIVMDDLHRVTQDLLKLQPGSNHVITGAVPVYVKTRQVVLQGFTNCCRLTFVLVLGIVVVMLRSLGAGFLAMIPNLLPVTVVLGILGWTGQRIEIGSMIAASIMIGITVGGTFHYLTWIQSSLRNGLTRRDAVVESFVYFGPAIWQARVIAAIGLLALLPAESMMVSWFGGTMAAMIGVAMIGDFFLLPQIVAGPLGWVYEPAIPKATTLTANEITKPPVSDQTTDATSENSSVPSPHIKPLVPAPKKRRPTQRREPDAG